VGVMKALDDIERSTMMASRGMARGTDARPRRTRPNRSLA